MYEIPWKVLTRKDYPTSTSKGIKMPRSGCRLGGMARPAPPPRPNRQQRRKFVLSVSDCRDHRAIFKMCSIRRTRSLASHSLQCSLLHQRLGCSTLSSPPLFHSISCLDHCSSLPNISIKMEKTNCHSPSLSSPTQTDDDVSPNRLIEIANSFPGNLVVRLFVAPLARYFWK